jgi:hypothetical protein
MHKREDDIKMYHREGGWGMRIGFIWFNIVSSGVAVVNTVIYVSDAQKAEKFLNK